MGSFESVTTVTVLIRPEADGLYAHSPDVPGLRVWGADEREVCDRITSGIELLYKLNNGKKVVARMAADKDLAKAPMRSANNFLVGVAA